MDNGVHGSKIKFWS